MNTNRETFKEIWAGLSSGERDKLARALARECDVAIPSVYNWAYGRTPRERAQNGVEQYLRKRGYNVSKETLFPIQQ